MFATETEDAFWRCRFSSQIDLVERLLTELRAHFKKRLMVLDEDGEVVVRELANNAIEHGNGGQAEKIVVVTCTFAPPSWTVAVEDQGPGFDHHGLDLTAGGGDGASGRHYGLSWVQVLADDLRFEDGGRRVVADLTASAMAPVVDHAAEPIQGDDVHGVVVLPALITAVQAEDLRTQLVGVLTDGSDPIVLDGSAVRSVDSLGLSVLLIFMRDAHQAEPPRPVVMRGVGGALARLLRMSHVEDDLGVRLEEGETHER